MDEQRKTDRPEESGNDVPETARAKAPQPPADPEPEAEGILETGDGPVPGTTETPDTPVDPEQRATAESPGRENKSGLKPVFVAVLCAALVLITALASAAVWREDTPWVAKVNGEKITQAELYDAMYANIGSEALQNLITEKLIAQEAKAQNVSIGKEELDARMNTLITKQFGSEEQFQQLLAMYNMSRADFEKQMKTQITVEKILEPSVNLGDDDLVAFFEDNRDRFRKPARVEVRHILSETREEAEEVRAAVAGGADFAAIARERSIDEATASRGGALGPVNHDDGLPSWLKTAFELTPGELSAVVESDDGFHVMEVTDHTPAATPEYEAVKDEVRQTALEEKMMTLYPEWLNNLLENAEIEYRE